MITSPTCLQTEIKQKICNKRNERLPHPHFHNDQFQNSKFKIQMENKQNIYSRLLQHVLPNH
jgi:hypothetical protein